jgi:hypothetical protein
MTRKLPRLADVTYIDAQGVVQQRYSIEWCGYWALWDNQLDQDIHVPGRGGRDTFWSEETGNNYLKRTTVRAYEEALLKEVERRLDRKTA